MDNSANSNEYAINVTGLTKEFDTMRAVNGISFHVRRGVFYGFLGTNGAGKSTTIKMLTGLLSPTAGQIEILGLDFHQYSLEIKRQIGVVPEDLALFDRLTAMEYLQFVGCMYGLSREVIKERAQQLLAFMDLTNEPKKLIVDFSHGMKKKIALSAALIHSPKLLFLDEPFEGVDAIAAKLMKDMLMMMIGRGATIFLTSHVLDIVEKLCSHVGIIHRGNLVAQGSIDELRAGIDMHHEDMQAGAKGKKLTLEEIFVEIIGGSQPATSPVLQWLTE